MKHVDPFGNHLYDDVAGAPSTLQLPDFEPLYEEYPGPGQSAQTAASGMRLLIGLVLVIAVIFGLAFYGFCHLIWLAVQ